MSTVTTLSERCASSGSMCVSSETQYPLQSTWSSAVPHVRRPINHRPSIPLVPNHLRSDQRARCLPPKGVNSGDIEVDDSNTGRNGHVASHHQLEPWGPISSLHPIPFVASSPSKGQPKRSFPKHDMGSWLRWAALRMILRGFLPPRSRCGIVAPTRRKAQTHKLT